MNDYKELIGDIGDLLITHPSETLCKRLLKQAADAIEQLVNEKNTLELLNHLERCEHDHTRKERDAAMADLNAIVHDMENTCICDYCIGCVSNGFREGCKTDDGDRWEWRGVQEDSDEKERNI